MFPHYLGKVKVWWKILWNTVYICQCVCVCVEQCRREFVISCWWQYQRRFTARRNERNRFLSSWCFVSARNTSWVIIVFSCIAIQSIEHKRVLEQTCHLSSVSVSVCLPACLSDSVAGLAIPFFAWGVATQLFTNDFWGLVNVPVWT